MVVEIYLIIIIFGIFFMIPLVMKIYRAVERINLLADALLEETPIETDLKCEKCGAEIYMMRYPRCDSCGHLHEGRNRWNRLKLINGGFVNG